MSHLTELKDLTPAERKKVFDEIIKSGILTKPADPGDIIEVDITITEAASD